MSYNAKVLNVMIASPSDCAKERQLVREVVHEWNAMFSADRALVLMPVSWETNSSPAMGDRAQAILNKQVLKNSDLLVGMFWAKFGTPTGNADSGTEEEISEHLALGKPALLYFSSVPVVPDSVDPQQYGALKAFKAKCMAEGLIRDYASMTEFREMLWRDMVLTISREFETGADDPRRNLTGGPATGPQLGAEANELLKEAAQDRSGIIMRIETLGGSHVQTNGRDFAEGQDIRGVARWRHAVDELERLGLIEDRAGKGEVFFITAGGFDAVDGARPELV